MSLHFPPSADTADKKNRRFVSKSRRRFVITSSSSLQFRDKSSEVPDDQRASPPHDRRLEISLRYRISNVRSACNHYVHASQRLVCLTHARYVHQQFNDALNYCDMDVYRRTRATAFHRCSLCHDIPFYVHNRCAQDIPFYSIAISSEGSGLGCVRLPAHSRYGHVAHRWSRSWGNQHPRLRPAPGRRGTKKGTRCVGRKRSGTREDKKRRVRPCTHRQVMTDEP